MVQLSIILSVKRSSVFREYREQGRPEQTSFGEEGGAVALGSGFATPSYIIPDLSMLTGMSPISYCEYALHTT